MSQTLVLPKRKQVPIQDYLRLRKQVQQTLLQGRKRAETFVEHEKARTYWKVGRLIDRYILKHKDRAGYGKQVIKQLARDLATNQTQLYYALEFARTYPIFPTRGKLEWRRYRSLLSIDGKDKRKALEREATKKAWSARTLEAKINELHQSKKASPFVPKRGTLHTYRIVAFKDKPLSLDLGFASYVKLDPESRKGFKDGDLVRGFLLSKLKKVSSEKKINLYTYRASLERVIDGDTLWMKIDLGFGIFIREKLRLRGLDTPELDTKAGEQAKRFVEQFLSTSNSKSLLITTTKPDKYDRYLSDIWLGQTNLNQLLFDRRLARAKTVVRPQDWNE